MKCFLCKEPGARIYDKGKYFCSEEHKRIYWKIVENAIKAMKPF